MLVDCSRKNPSLHNSSLQGKASAKPLELSKTEMKAMEVWLLEYVGVDAFRIWTGPLLEIHKNIMKFQQREISNNTIIPGFQLYNWHGLVHAKFIFWEILLSLNPFQICTGPCWDFLIKYSDITFRDVWLAECLLNSYVKSFGYLIPVESLEPGWNHLNPIEPCWNPLNDLYGSGQLWPMKYPEHDNMHPHCLDILWHHMLVIAVCVSAWICLIITMVQTHAIYGEILTFETILNNSCWVTCIYLLLFGRQTLRISARAIAKICRREPVWHAPLSLDRMVSGSCITWATKSHYLEMAHGGLSRIRRGFGWSPTG